ncbi:MAG: flagellar biosynthesis protein FlhF [Chlamydiales bacterium]|jgi:flagellar biosynthesis protein FlhF
MDLQQVEGKNMRDALERARDAIGERAVVISHSRGEDGRVVLAVSNDVPRSVQALQALRVEAARTLRDGAAERTQQSPIVCDDVERRMHMSGCSAKFVARVVEETRSRQDRDGHPLDVAADVIGATFPVARARAAAGTTPIMAFLGPTGVGKTTTIAKLAARLARAGRRVALTTFDRGPLEGTLQAYAKLLGLPCLDVTTLDWKQVASDHDVVLLDTSGNVRGDTLALGRLAYAGPPGLRVDSYLVFSAAHSAAALEETVRLTAPLEPVGCVLTKLDEVPLPGPILEQVLGLSLPVAFLSDGASFNGRFHRAAPERFADLCLRGRIS